ncbi:MAG: hypothetical protein FWD40_01175 [Treponema sp.]|nr:hypothetical protein [Treponema sp.]
MIGFLLKKTLYDLWDNLFKIVLLNLGFFASCAIPIFLPQLVAGLTGSGALEIVSNIIGIFVCSIYLSAASQTVKSISDYGTFSFLDVLKNLKTAWPAGIVMGLFVFILFMIFSYVIPFYLSIDSAVAGLILAAIVFWTTIFAILSFQFYFSVIGRLSPNLIKAMKKCMLISLDNTGLAIFLIINNLAALFISVVFAFMFPGPVGVLLYLDQALRLRLLKYDWLEANPGANRRKIPWDAILIEERERTGTRTLKNFVFPWKD